MIELEIFSAEIGGECEHGGLSYELDCLSCLICSYFVSFVVGFFLIVFLCIWCQFSPGTVNESVWIVGIRLIVYEACSSPCTGFLSVRLMSVWPAACWTHHFLRFL